MSKPRASDSVYAIESTDLAVLKIDEGKRPCQEFHQLSRPLDARDTEATILWCTSSGVPTPSTSFIKPRLQ